jgi:hypothetical protein
MQTVSEIARRVPNLTKEERLEIFNLQRLFVCAPRAAQLKAVARMNPLLESGRVDARSLMKAVREVAYDLLQSLPPGSR